MDERVLLVEDDASIREVVALALQRAGLQVTTAVGGRDGLLRAQRGSADGTVDLVILDVMLPDLDGFEVCRELRRTSRVPVLMLTARTDLVDVVVGLESGADDYVRKPFEPAELLARARALLRRAAAPADEPKPLHVADLEIDPVTHTVRRDGAPITLTVTEFRLLYELARHPGRVFTRQILLELVWDYDYLGDSRLVDVAVQRLRSKVEADPREPKLIRTVRGVGYQLTVR
ncbi:MAG: winged helix-turn-helix domain-containing protein [Micromonosporaceae bacterium]